MSPIPSGSHFHSKTLLGVPPILTSEKIPGFDDAPLLSAPMKGHIVGRQFERDLAGFAPGWSKTFAKRFEPPQKGAASHWQKRSFKYSCTTSFAGRGRPLVFLRSRSHAYGLAPRRPWLGSNAQIGIGESGKAQPRSKFRIGGAAHGPCPSSPIFPFEHLVVVGEQAIRRAG